MGNVKKREPKRGTFIEAHTASAAAVTNVCHQMPTLTKNPWGLFSNLVLKEIYNRECLWELGLAKI